MNCDHLDDGWCLDCVKKERDHLEAVQKELAAYKLAFSACDEHKPNGGARTDCLECALIRMANTISQIDYLVGEPNEMRCSLYEVEYNERAVVSRVAVCLESYRSALRESTELLRKALPPEGVDTTRIYGPIENQIAANEAVLKGGA